MLGSTFAKQGVGFFPNDWIALIGLLIDNMIVPVTVFQIFNSIAELGAANLIEVSSWQAVTQNLGVGLLSDICRISDFFWKLGGGIIIEHGTILGSLRYSDTAHDQS